MKASGFSFLWRAALAASAVVLVSYSAHAAAGVFGRSTESVAMTRWVSFDQATVSFGKESGEIATDGESRAFLYRENAGAVLATFEGGGAMRLTRFYSDRLMTSDGKTVFYLMGGE